MASANWFYPRLTWYYVNRAGDNSTAALRYQQKLISNLVMQFTCQLAEKFILFVLGCAPLAGINAQTTDSTSGLQTSLNVSESDPAGGIRSLVDAKQWDRAAELTVALRDVISDQIVTWQPAPNSPGTITYLSWQRYMNQVTGQLFAANPEFVAAWRKRVRLRVQSLMTSGFPNIEQQRKFVERYMFAEGGAQQLINLSARYAEAGHLEDAIWFLSQLDTRFERFRKTSGETVGRGLSESSITEQELAEAAARLIVMSVLNEPGRYLADWFPRQLSFQPVRHPAFGWTGLRKLYTQDLLEEVTWFQEQFGTAEGTLGNQSGPLHKLLDDWFFSLVQHTKDVRHHTLEPTFPTDGKSWEIVLSKKSPTFSESSSSSTIQIRPVIANSTTLIWRDSNRIYAANLKDSKPLFNNGISNRSSATDPFVVWQNIRESNWPKPVVGFDQHLLSSTGDWAFGVFDEAESNVLVGIDLDKEGRLLPGFPIAPPDSSWQFEGPPVIEDDKLFIAARKFVSGDHQIESHVLCYALRMNEFSAPLTQLWSTKIGQSQLQPATGISSVDARRQRRSACRLTMANQRIFLCNDHGLIACLRQASGEVEWLVTYPRSNYASDDPFQSQLPKRRFGLNPLIHYESVFVMPSDSPYLISINQFSGMVQWQTFVPASNQFIDVAETDQGTPRDVLLGGDQLVWLDRKDGTLQARFPDLIPNVLPGMRKPPEPGHGFVGIIPEEDGSGTVFFPTDKGIDYLTRWQHFLKDADAKHNTSFTGGGHVLIENGMMIVANDQRIAAIPVSEFFKSSESASKSVSDSEQDDP